MSTANKLERALVQDDTCPKCLGELDEGWECTKCGYDAKDDAALVPPETIAKLHAMVKEAKAKQ